MKSNTMPKTDEECRQEIDRLTHEIRTMLDDTKKIGARSRRIASQNQLMREELKERLLCGNK